MRAVAATVLLLLGLVAIVVGIGCIYWPAGIIVAGIFAAALAIVLDIPDHSSEEEPAAEIVDETHPDVPIIARVKG